MLLKSSYQIFYLLSLTDHPVESLAPTSPFQSRALFVIVPARVLYLGADTGLSYRIPRTEVASSFSLRALLVHVPARILHLESNHDMIPPMHSFLSSICPTNETGNVRTIYDTLYDSSISPVIPSFT